ncbi:MAG: hypothetical protein QOJ29_2248 [Thermoleophilaceae bacterium]|nr:hypothetical protein [Thermoleophilaceae bacterium]
MQIAAGNKDLVTGRVYMAWGEDLAMVVYDDTIFSEYLSTDYQPSMQDLVNRMENGFAHTSQWTTEIREKFGGRPFSREDWGLLTF